MSEAVSALNGASFEGFAQVAELGLKGMITVRGDLDAKEMAEAVKSATGCAMPGQRAIVEGDGKSVAWMSPDELLILCDYAETADVIASLEIGLAGAHFLAANVSDARAQFRVSGSGARDAVAKLAPVDLSADAFGEGDFRRSRLTQAPAAMWMNAEDSIDLVCFRSAAPYVMGLLKVAVAKGSEVGFSG